MNKKGFTLIELLIVITIIGILTVLGARQFGDDIKRANAAADKSNAQTISNAVQQAILMSGASPATVARADATLTNAGGYDITNYISNIPAVKAVTNGTWQVAVTSSGAVEVYVKNGDKICKLQPATSDVDNYPDSGFTNAA